MRKHFFTTRVLPALRTHTSRTQQEQAIPPPTSPQTTEGTSRTLYRNQQASQPTTQLIITNKMSSATPTPTTTDKNNNNDILALLPDADIPPIQYACNCFRRAQDALEHVLLAVPSPQHDLLPACGPWAPNPTLPTFPLPDTDCGWCALKAKGTKAIRAVWASKHRRSGYVAALPAMRAARDRTAAELAEQLDQTMQSDGNVVVGDAGFWVKIFEGIAAQRIDEIHRQMAEKVVVRAQLRELDALQEGMF